MTVQMHRLSIIIVVGIKQVSEQILISVFAIKNTYMTVFEIGIFIIILIMFVCTSLKIPIDASIAETITLINQAEKKLDQKVFILKM